MIAVVYLVWGPLGPGYLREFVASYRRHRSGVDHDLVVVYNGVGRDDRPALDAELELVDHKVIRLQTPVLDLAAYAQVAASLQHERLCFMNSYCKILAPEWLAKLDDALDRPKVGLVGATGSWASRRSVRLNSFFLPNPYSGVLPKGGLRHFPALEGALDIERSGRRWSPDGRQSAPKPKMPGPRWYIRQGLKTVATTPGDLWNFEAFPSHHVRTNAFVMRRVTFANLRMGTVAKKTQAYALESGRNSFTRQVEQHQLRTLVVASDGSAYESDQWYLSETFWQGRQQGLLIGDNQTRLYEGSTFEHRRFLSALAWGSEARPQT